MNFSDLENGVRSLQNGLCDGFYAQNTNTLTGFANTQSALSNGFSTMNNAICNLGYQTQSGVNTINTAAMQNTNTIQQDINSMNIANMQNANALQTQISSCCCDTQSNLKDIAYQIATDTCSINTNAANNTRDIIEAENTNARAILDAIQQNKVDAMQDKIATLTAQNQQLSLAASQQAQNAYLINELRPNPIPAYITCSPYQSSYGLCGCSSIA